MTRPVAILLLAGLLAASVSGQARRPLTPADIDDIATLLRLEDTRTFDETALARILRSAHPEVRRRAAVSIGRINDPRGARLVLAVREDPDVEVVASVAFALGQLKHADAVSWLDSQLGSPQASPAVQREAAQVLGKIRTPEARVALGRYLLTAPPTAAAAPVVGEALLAIGRFTTREDLAPILRWTSAADIEVRWRAAWALFRPRDPAAAPHLLKLVEDPSGDVRFWAVRGLAPASVDGAGLDRTAVTVRLRALMDRDPDRRVRTEALRALVQFDDDTAFGGLLAGLRSPDTWLSVSAAEAAGRFAARAADLVPALVAASGPDRPTALRVTALTPLVTLWPDQAVVLTSSLARSDTVAARTAGVQALGRLGEPGRVALDALAADPAMAGRLPPAGGARGGGGGGAGGGRGTPVPRPARPDAEYRQLVERWIVPDYEGRPRPRVVWDTPRGTIEIELYPGDAPFGVEHLLRVIESGDIVGTEFTRVVPNFVAQQQAIRNAAVLRDEVSRHGLTRGNLSWASAGLDTGRPGYTLGSTPQPHNEGDFTALGRVVVGLDVVDRLELGDPIVAARIR